MKKIDVKIFSLEKLILNFDGFFLTLNVNQTKSDLREKIANKIHIFKLNVKLLAIVILRIERLLF